MDKQMKEQVKDLVKEAVKNRLIELQFGTASPYMNALKQIDGKLQRIVNELEGIDSELPGIKRTLEALARNARKSDSRQPAQDKWAADMAESKAIGIDKALTDIGRALDQLKQV